MSRLVSLRSSLKEQLAERGVQFSYMPVIIKATSMTLRDFPSLNAHVNPDCTEVVYKADHNIGIAMDTPEGLVVPTIKQVQVQSMCMYIYIMCMCIIMYNVMCTCSMLLCT